VIDRAFRGASLDGGKMTLWVINCRDAIDWARQLYPNKQTPRSLAIAAV
jgi:hypothetical protein